MEITLTRRKDRSQATGSDGGAAAGSGGGKPAFTFIDLFAGIGGMRLGLAEAGGTCAYSCEIDRFARKTYIENFGECEGEDIRTVDATTIPDHDLLAAGFPCQPFSLAGVSKKNSMGRKHGFEDEQSGNLFFEIVRILEAKRPPLIFLENVKHLRSHDSGRTFARIMELLAPLYHVDNRVIDARRWVPQHRERTFIVGVLRAAHPDPWVFAWPSAPEGAGPVLSSILERRYEPRYILTDSLWTYLQKYRRRHEAAGNGFGYSKVGPDDVSRTLSARYYKDGSEILINRGPNRNPRRLTPTECGRLMGFPQPTRGARPETVNPSDHPKRFYVPVSDVQAYRQFGNAVVPAVIEHLATRLARDVNLPALRERVRSRSTES